MLDPITEANSYSEVDRVPVVKGAQEVEAASIHRNRAAVARPDAVEFIGTNYFELRQDYARLTLPKVCRIGCAKPINGVPAATASREWLLRARPYGYKFCLDCIEALERAMAEERAREDLEDDALAATVTS